MTAFFKIFGKKNKNKKLYSQMVSISPRIDHQMYEGVMLSFIFILYHKASQLH